MTTENWISLGMLLIAIVSAIIAGGSLWFTYKQWKKLKKKIGMINDSGKAIEILPAWYTTRMMPKDLGEGLFGVDYWAFGLLMSDGRTLVVTSISSLSDDGKWMDVKLATEDTWSLEAKPDYVFAIAADRTTASVQVSHVITAMELITS